MNHVPDGMLEPNPKTVHGEPILKMEGLSECHLTNTDLVLDHRQAPEHSKPPMFLQISLEFLNFDALGYKR